MRYKKTLIEKYGVVDKSDDANEFINLNRNKIDSDEIFHVLPYLGIFYIPVEYKDFYFEYDKPSMSIKGKDYIRAKVVRADKFEYYYYDDHHKNIVHGSKDGNLYYMKGNIIHKL